MRRIEIRSMLDTTDNDEDVCTALTRAISESPVCAQVYTIMVREMDVREPSTPKIYNGHYDYCDYFESCGEIVLPCTCKR